MPWHAIPATFRTFYDRNSEYEFLTQAGEAVEVAIVGWDADYERARSAPETRER